MPIQPDDGVRVYPNIKSAQLDLGNEVKTVAVIQYDHGDRVSRIWPALLPPARIDRVTYSNNPNIPLDALTTYPVITKDDTIELTINVQGIFDTLEYSWDRVGTNISALRPFSSGSITTEPGTAGMVATFTPSSIQGSDANIRFTVYITARGTGTNARNNTSAMASLVITIRVLVSPFSGYVPPRPHTETTAVTAQFIRTTGILRYQWQERSFLDWDDIPNATTRTLRASRAIQFLGDKAFRITWFIANPDYDPDANPGTPNSREELRLFGDEFRIVQAALPAPTLVSKTATRITLTSQMLDAAIAVGAEKYLWDFGRIDSGGNIFPVVTGTNRVTLTRLAPNTQYSIRVAGQNSFDQGGYGPALAVTTESDPLRYTPDVPDEPTLVSKTHDTIRARTSEILGATSYEWRYVNSNTEVVQTQTTTGRSVVISGLADGINYTISVRTINSVGMSEYSGSLDVMTDTLQPAVPSVPRRPTLGRAFGATFVEIIPRDVSDESGNILYRWQVSTTSDFSSGVRNFPSHPSTRLTIGTLPISTIDHWVRVSAERVRNDVSSSFSEWSPVLSIPAST